MVKSNIVKKGSKISKEFLGGSFEEQSITRKALFATIVLRNPTNYTAEQVTQANENIVKFEEYNTKVMSLLIP